jgi:hypothetical protein
MKIYIDRKSVQAVENAKLPVRKPGDLFSRRKNGKKICVLKDLSYCLGCRMFMTVCMEDAVT